MFMYLVRFCGGLSLIMPYRRVDALTLYVGDRETTDPAGYGSAGTAVHLILAGHKELLVRQLVI
jgi:hypothetical protein